MLVLSSKDSITAAGPLTLEEFSLSSTHHPDSPDEEKARLSVSYGTLARSFDSQLAPGEETLLRRLLFRLIRMGEASRVVERAQLPANADILLTNPAAADLVSRLSAKGLLSLESTGAGTDKAYVLADSALLTEWPTLQEVVKQRLSLRELATGWKSAGGKDETRARSALLTRGPILDMADDYKDLSRTEVEFIAESRQIATHMRRVQLTFLIGAVVILSVLCLVLWQQNDVLRTKEADLAAALTKATESEQTARTAESLAQDKAAAATKAEALAKDSAAAARMAEEQARKSEAAARAAEAEAQKARAEAEAARKSEKESAEKALADLRVQLDAATKALADLRTNIDAGQKAVQEVNVLKSSLQKNRRLSAEEVKSFDSTLVSLTTSIKQAETSEQTAKQLVDTTGQAAVAAQTAAKEATPNPAPTLTHGWVLFGWLDTTPDPAAPSPAPSSSTPPAAQPTAQPAAPAPTTPGTSAPVRLRYQSFAPTTGERGTLPKPGDTVKAEAFMNVRDNITLNTDGTRWNQGKPVDLLRKGQEVIVTDVKWQKGVQPPAVWIQFKKP